MSLYKIYIRPHIEFAISAWSPFLKRDIDVIEKVQRRVTRVPKALHGVEYQERLERMGLTTLETRRTRGDLIQLFKIVRGADLINWYREPTWSVKRSTKRSQLRRELVASCQQRYNFFYNRIANIWNALPDEIVEAGSINKFKCMIDKHLISTTAS